MELQRAGVRRDREARAHSPRGQAGGDRVGHAVALQSRGELHCRHAFTVDGGMTVLWIAV
jgi:hypothetical protein